MNRALASVYLYPCLILALIAAGYLEVWQWMYDRFTSPDSYYSHGFLVPFVSAFFVWRRRAELRQAPIRPCAWGLLLIVAAVLVHLLGTMLYVFSLSAFTLPVLAAGAVLYLFGPRISRLLLFPLAFLFFMIPLPMAVINQIAFPLKMLVAASGVAIVALTGIPVYREGFTISIPAGQLLVGNPCSGLRSLIAFMALSAVLAKIGSLSAPRQWVLFFLAIPIAVVSNIVRVPLLVLISHAYGLEAASRGSFWHDASGVLVFLLGLLLLLAAARVLEWKS